jgi:hypothetical protein
MDLPDARISHEGFFARWTFNLRIDPCRAKGKVVAVPSDPERKRKGELKNYFVPFVSPRKNGVSSKSFGLLASPTGFEPVLPP